MAATRRYECIECGDKPRRPSSQFCSALCVVRFMKDMPFVLACRGTEARGCLAGATHFRTPAEAEAEGWREIEPDPEGLRWNYSGLCPECAPVEVEPTPDVIV